MHKPLLLLGVLLALAGCAAGAAQLATPAPAHPPTLLPSQLYPSTFGIAYDRPARYLAQGEQTRLDDPAVIGALRGREPGLAHLGEIYFWVAHGFATWPAGGQTIGIVTAQQLLAERRLGGCHDWGLVYAATVRELGYPAVVVDAASIAWARSFQAGQKGPYAGHVFVEVFVGDKWILIDPANNWYVANGYDPANPIIPLQGNSPSQDDEPTGFYVMRKGLDTWGYGIRSVAELNRMMEESARQLKIETLAYPPYAFQRFK